MQREIGIKFGLMLLISWFNSNNPYGVDNTNMFTIASSCLFLCFCVTSCFYPIFSTSNSSKPCELRVDTSTTFNPYFFKYEDVTRIRQSTYRMGVLENENTVRIALKGIQN